MTHPSLRPQRESSAHHRGDARHRQVDRRGAGARGRQGGDLQPEGRGLRAGPSWSWRKAASKCSPSRATCRARRTCRRWSMRRRRNGAASTSWSPTRPPIPTTARSPSIADDAFDKIIANNVKSVLWLAGMTLPGMAGEAGAASSLVGSIGGILANTVIGAYGISKAADHHLVRNLAAEWGPKNVRVNAIAPGLIKTEFARALWEDEKRRARAHRRHAAAAPGRAARHRRHRRVPRLAGVCLHHRAVHRRGRRSYDHLDGSELLPGRAAFRDEVRSWLSGEPAGRS